MSRGNSEYGKMKEDVKMHLANARAIDVVRREQKFDDMMAETDTDTALEFISDEELARQLGPMGAA